MRSESARATTTAEARFRIAAPNALPRLVTVIALDRAGEEIVRRLALAQTNARFLTASAFAAAAAQAPPPPGWLSDFGGRAADPLEEVAATDLVVLVATPGANAPAARVIGEACRRKGAMTTALVVGQAASPELSATLAELRPYAPMLVVASSEDYVADMLTALRA
jgi:hypothetical protein